MLWYYSLGGSLHLRAAVVSGEDDDVVGRHVVEFGSIGRVELVGGFAGRVWRILAYLMYEEWEGFRVPYGRRRPFIGAAGESSGPLSGHKVKRTNDEELFCFTLLDTGWCEETFYSTTRVEVFMDWLVIGDLKISDAHQQGRPIEFLMPSESVCEGR